MEDADDFEFFNSILNYDKNTGFIYWKIKPSVAVNIGDLAGCLESRGYVRVGILGSRIRAHKIVWLLCNKKWPTNQLDHINGKRADNRIENLRECTQAENAQNLPLLKRNTSGYMGVCYDKSRNKWNAAIRYNHITKNLGRYDSPELASRAYLDAKKIFHTFQPVPFNREEYGNQA